MQADRFIVNVEVVVVREGRYLATTRAAAEEFGAGWVGFPGGKMDAGGSLQDALETTARREVLEEVGLHLVDPVIYIESHTFGDEPVLDVVMMARALDGQPTLVAPDEVSAITWLTFETYMTHPDVEPWTRASLALAEVRRQELGW